MPAFLERYPDVEIELAMSEAFVDLVEAGLESRHPGRRPVRPVADRAPHRHHAAGDGGFLGLSGAARDANGSRRPHAGTIASSTRDWRPAIDGISRGATGRSRWT